MKKKLLGLALVVGLSAGLAGCLGLPSLGQVSSSITTFNQNVGRIAPIVGKDVILLGDALVQIECSPAMQLLANGATAAIAVTGSTNSTALTAQSYLQNNAKIAAALCPVYQGVRASIVAQVAPLPTSTPSQVISVPAATN